MSDVFVSYKAEDRRRVKPLVEALEAEGFSVWWDEQIGGGTAWRHSIEVELNAAKCVIVVWSNRSVGPDGTFVQDEATRAQQRHVYVPVLIDKVHLPLGFGETQALPLTGWHGNRSDPRYQAVLSAVRRNVGGASAPAKPVARASVDRRAVLAGGAVTAVAVAGVGGWALLKPSSASASDSIAVLPFANLSGDPNQAYFSDGIAEEIRSALARVAGLKVVGRTSSEALRNDDAETVAKKLGVLSILTGSVRQSPSTIRVSAELIDGRTGLEKWSQDYDRNPGDAIKIQTDIAENVATALSAALGRVALAAVAIGGTSNAAAHDLYLKAQEQLLSDNSEDGLRHAIGLLDAAIALDPKFAEAYARKAVALGTLTGYFPGMQFETGFAQATSVARQAVSVAPDLPMAHTALADTLVNQLDFAGALAEFRKAYALSSGDVGNLLDYSRFLAFLGDYRAGFNLTQQARARDPLNPVVYSIEGRLFADNRNFVDAANSFRKALQIAPKRWIDRALLAAALLYAGRNNDARAELSMLPPDSLYRLVGEAILSWRQGNRAASDAALQHARQVVGDSGSFQFAEVEAQRGHVDEAFANLDRGLAIRDPGLVNLKVDPFLDPIRSDPRYVSLLQKMNFPS